MIKPLLWTFLILVGSSLLSGCAKTISLSPWVSKFSMMKEPIGPEEIFRLPEVDQASFIQILDDLSTAGVIFVGETHDQIEHHQIQARVLQGLLERRRDIVVAMEMFETSQQSILDRWSQGVLTEEEFLEEIKWETTWGVDYYLYKDVLDEIKRHRLKALALNIQKELVRKVAENGIEGLSPEDKEKLPEMDLTDQEHRTYIESIYSRHQGGLARDFEHFYQAQCLWDEGMAETLSKFLKSSDREGMTVLVFVGSGHVAFHFGIPKRFYRRTSIPYKTIVLKEWKKRIEEDLDFSGTSSPLANFVWITKPTPPEKKRPRIGVVLKEKEDPKGIWIERVIPDSPAEKAGLLPGDQFIAVGGKEITKVKDIHDALNQKGWGKEVTVVIIRKGVRKEITVTLPPPED